MKSTSKFIWKQILFVIKSPWLLIQIIRGKKEASSLLKPLGDFWRYLTHFKITFWLIFLNVVGFIAELILLNTNPDVVAGLVFQPEHLTTFNIFPIIASWFMHAGFLHLFGNLLFLFTFGRIVENHYGIWMPMIYFLAAVTADILSAIFGFGGIGASGAIAGLVAAAILLEPFQLNYMAFGIPIPMFIVGWLAIAADITGLLVPTDTVINHAAHVGGYASVFIVFIFSKVTMKNKLRKGALLNFAGLCVLALVAWLL